MAARAAAARAAARSARGGGGQGKSAQMLLPGFIPDISDFDAPVKVASVPKGGQAEKAGVKAGMDVVAVEGKDVANWSEFRTRARESARRPRIHAQAGDKVKITFKRRRQETRSDARAGNDGVHRRVWRRRRPRGRHTDAAVHPRPHRRRATAERPEGPGQGRLPDRRRLHVARTTATPGRASTA